MVLDGIGLRQEDIKTLQQKGKETAKTAMKAVKKARKYAKDDYHRREQSSSSDGRQSASFSSRSPRSHSSRASRRAQNRRSTEATIELTRPPTPQQQERRGTREYQRRPEPRHTPREPPHVVSIPPSPNASESTSSRSTVEVEPERPRSMFYGSRVRDDGNAVIVEESEWPARVVNPSELSRTFSERSASLERSEKRNVGVAKQPRRGDGPSAKASQPAGVHEDQGAVQRLTRRPRFGEAYEPCGLFTGSDLEERRRRDKNSGGRDDSDSD